MGVVPLLDEEEEAGLLIARPVHDHHGGGVLVLGQDSFRDPTLVGMMCVGTRA